MTDIVYSPRFGGFSLSAELQEALGLDYSEQRSIARDNPELVRLVREWGSSRASGNWADLQVVTIPDDVEWEIMEYDGNEWVAEKHRTWGQ